MGEAKTSENHAKDDDIASEFDTEIKEEDDDDEENNKVTLDPLCSQCGAAFKSYICCPCQT